MTLGRASGVADFSGASFRDAAVSDHYVYRPPYARKVYGCIVDHAPATARLLDLGCGEGKIARPMSQVFDQVIAVDPSENMIALGRSLKNGRATNISWVPAMAEEAALEGRFDVVTFASSIHWMDPKALFSKLARHVTPDHLVAIITGDEAFEPPWETEWREFLAKWVPRVTGRVLGSREWHASRERHLAHMDVIGMHEFVSTPFEQTVEGFILCQHSRNSFTLSNLGADLTEFCEELQALLEPHRNEDGLLSYRIKTRLTLARLRDVRATG